MEKKFDPSQPAHFVQADMGRYCLLAHENSIFQGVSHLLQYRVIFCTLRALLVYCLIKVILIHHQITFFIILLTLKEISW